jgi:hypothetical protein
VVINSKLMEVTVEGHDEAGRGRPPPPWEWNYKRLEVIYYSFYGRAPTPHILLFIDHPSWLRTDPA